MLLRIIYPRQNNFTLIQIFWHYVRYMIEVSKRNYFVIQTSQGGHTTSKTREWKYNDDTDELIQRFWWCNGYNITDAFKYSILKRKHYMLMRINWFNNHKHTYLPHWYNIAVDNTHTSWGIVYSHERKIKRYDSSKWWC